MVSFLLLNCRSRNNALSESSADSTKKKLGLYFGTSAIGYAVSPDTEYETLEGWNRIFPKTTDSLLKTLRSKYFIDDFVVPFSNAPGYSNLDRPRIVFFASRKRKEPLKKSDLVGRLFFATIPEKGKATKLEFISWNFYSKQFDFGIIKNFDTGKEVEIEFPERSECVICHRNGGPIFSLFPWPNTIFNTALKKEFLDALAKTDTRYKKHTTDFQKMIKDSVGASQDEIPDFEKRRHKYFLEKTFFGADLHDSFFVLNDFQLIISFVDQELRWQRVLQALKSSERGLTEKFGRFVVDLARKNKVDGSIRSVAGVVKNNSEAVKNIKWYEILLPNFDAALGKGHEIRNSVQIERFYPAEEKILKKIRSYSLLRASKHSQKKSLVERTLNAQKVLKIEKELGLPSLDISMVNFSPPLSLLFDYQGKVVGLNQVQIPEFQELVKKLRDYSKSDEGKNWDKILNSPKFKKLFAGNRIPIRHELLSTISGLMSEFFKIKHPIKAHAYEQRVVLNQRRNLSVPEAESVEHPCFTCHKVVRNNKGVIVSEGVGGFLGVEDPLNPSHYSKDVLKKFPKIACRVSEQIRKNLMPPKSSSQFKDKILWNAQKKRDALKTLKDLCPS